MEWTTFPPGAEAQAQDRALVSPWAKALIGPDGNPVGVTVARSQGLAAELATRILDRADLGGQVELPGLPTVKALAPDRYQVGKAALWGGDAHETIMDVIADLDASQVAKVAWLVLLENPTQSTEVNQ